MIEGIHRPKTMLQGVIQTVTPSGTNCIAMLPCNALIKDKDLRPSRPSQKVRQKEVQFDSIGSCIKKENPPPRQSYKPALSKKTISPPTATEPFANTIQACHPYRQIRRVGNPSYPHSEPWRKTRTTHWKIKNIKKGEIGTTRSKTWIKI